MNFDAMWEQTSLRRFFFINLTTYLWPIKFNRFLSNKFSTIKNYIKFIITTLEPSERLLHADVSTTTWTFCANRNTKMLLPFCSAITCLINKIIKILCRKTFHFSTPSVPPTSFLVMWYALLYVLYILLVYSSFQIFVPNYIVALYSIFFKIKYFDRNSSLLHRIELNITPCKNYWFF